MNKQTFRTIASVLIAGLALATSASAQDTKHYRFAHDQQLNSGYSIAYDIFSAKLKELSGGKMLVDQFPGAQLGQEPQLLQLVKAGDLEDRVGLSFLDALTPRDRTRLLDMAPAMWSRLDLC